MVDSDSPQSARFAGIVLCGGRSVRMGRPKHALPLGSETMLQRVVGILSEVVAPIVVVAAPQQHVAPLADGIDVARDDTPHLGPLAGIAAGLSALGGRAEAAYVTACDVPLLRPEFVRRMCETLGAYDLVIPRDGCFHHPLAAVYRLSLQPLIRELLAVGQRRPLALVERADARVVDVDDLREVDPDLSSLRNTNTIAEYHAVLAELGLQPVDATARQR